jgi:hypothetical protein
MKNRTDRQKIQHQSDDVSLKRCDCPICDLIQKDENIDDEHEC